MKEGTFALSDKQKEQIKKQQQEWSELKSNLEETPILGELISRTKTLDQAKALLTFIEAITEKTLRSTIALTAARGRGKSAALGLAVASAIGHQYSNIFVTCPSPENLKSFFDFVLIGFDALQFKEHVDYEVLQSTDASLQHCVVRINVFRSHRQTIQYIDPRDASKALHQAELLVIDEAAAIPLPIVKSMLGPYLIFMSSTITGYEGTGRSLSLKLFDQLRKGAHSDNRPDSFHLAEGGRTFREITLEAPIRYAIGDPIESWLYDVLCLEAGKGPQPLIYGCPHPHDCQLYRVNRDALFSGHPLAESFLQTIMALFVSSHYKNSPNDLQLLSDAPAHRLFVLIAPTKKQLDSNGLPQVLCAIQVCLEGQISKEYAQASMSRGYRGAGDLIPWTISQQFQDSSFASLSGVRVVRIATHPDVQRMGYGSRALTLLNDYYSGKMISLTEDGWRGTLSDEPSTITNVDNSNDTLNHERLEPRKELPPLLEPLNVPDRVDYLGVSYGLTYELFCFWKKQGMVPLYIRLVANEYTGEHTCIMLKQLPEQSKMSWLSNFFHDFIRRFLALLPFAWSSWNPALTLQIIDYGKEYYASHQVTMLNEHNMHLLLSTFDIQRLEAYAKNLIDYHMIVDLLPTIAKLYFSGQLDKEIHLSAAQSAILVSVGLQYMDLDRLEKVLNVPAQQLLALLNKMIRKFAHYFKELEWSLMESHDASTIITETKTSMKDTNETLEPKQAPLVKKPKKNMEHKDKKEHRKHRLE
ncbi:N-acetyltransferase 10 [Galdieria sulphuraria]|nr:N-acetyltransferase 10 [Galdieria sulphuraria]